MNRLPFCRQIWIYLCFFSGLFLVSALSLPQPCFGQGQVTYELNPKRSLFMVHAKRGGLFKFFGHDHIIGIRDFNGSVSLTPESIEPAAMQMSIKADSLEVLDDVDEEERQKITTDMCEKVLETAHYPEITFASTKVEAEKKSEREYQVEITGNLTLHGVTRPLKFEAKMTLEETSLRAVGKFSLKQKDYDIKPASAAGGTVTVKDKLEFTFDIIAERAYSTDAREFE